MTRTTDSLGRIALVVAAVLVAVPLVGGLLAGVWRFVTWGAVSGHSGYGPVSMHGSTPHHAGGWMSGAEWMGGSPMVGGVNVGLGLPLGTLLGWAAFLAALFGAAYLLYRRFGGDVVARGDPAIEELRTAYARGDLSDEEFERRRSRLDPNGSEST